MESAPAYRLDWTTWHFQDWGRWLGPLRDKPVRGIEIGTFEGRSSRWFLENIITHPDSHLTCIDPYSYDAEHEVCPGGASMIHDKFDWEEVYETAKQNLMPWLQSAQCRLLRHSSQFALNQLVIETDLTPNPQFHFAYIDGSHVARCVLEDTVAVWPMMLAGGILIWDDYRWSSETPTDDPELFRPQIAIDSWLRIYKGCYDSLEESNGQVKIRKIR